MKRGINRASLISWKKGEIKKKKSENPNVEGKKNRESVLKKKREKK